MDVTQFISMPEEWKESRNVKRVKDKEKRYKLLKEKKKKL